MLLPRELLARNARTLYTIGVPGTAYSVTKFGHYLYQAKNPFPVYGMKSYPVLI